MCLADLFRIERRSTVPALCWYDNFGHLHAHYPKVREVEKKVDRDSHCLRHNIVNPYARGIRKEVES
jgi:hypothetical protein